MVLTTHMRLPTFVDAGLKTRTKMPEYLRSKTLRSFSLFAAAFILIVISFVQFTHTCASNSPAYAGGYDSSIAMETVKRAASQPCLACLIADAFLTAKGTIFVFIFYIASLSSQRSPCAVAFYRNFIGFGQYIRAPPALSTISNSSI